MRSIKNFFIKIKDFIGKNYWLQPVLLVAVVFIVVFSITGISDLFATIKGWFTPDSDTCTNCTTYKSSQFSQFDTILTEAVDEQEPVFVIITQANCASCATMYPLLNKFLKTNDDFTLYQLRLEFDDQGKVIFDNANSKAKFTSLAQAVYDVAIGNGANSAELQSAMFNGGSEISFATPTMFIYANNSPDQFNNILRYKVGSFASSELLLLTDFLTKTTNGYYTLDY